MATSLKNLDHPRPRQTRIHPRPCRRHPDRKSQVRALMLFLKLNLEFFLLGGYFEIELFSFVLVSLAVVSMRKLGIVNFSL